MILEVELKAFDGPLDLLLSLIEKNKINIFDIPIVEITDQYLSYVRKMQEENLDVMSEFMVMAAELIAIKCRMLLPKEDDETEEEEDPREELVRRLLEYKTYKYMASELRDYMEDAGERLFKDDTTPSEVRKYRPPVNIDELVGSLTLERLHEVFEAVLKRQSDKIDPLRSRFGTIEREEVSLPEKLENIAGYAKRHRSFSFRQLIEGTKSRTQIVVTFLAVLELMSYGYLTASQDEVKGDIFLEKVDGADVESIREKFRESEFDENSEGDKQDAGAGSSD